MSGPVIIVRKIKHGNQRKIEKITESSSKMHGLISEDLRVDLSRSLGPSQGSIALKKSRSSSLIKQKLIPSTCENLTPLNKKLKNRSYLSGNPSDLAEIYQHTHAAASISDLSSKNLDFLEKWLAEQIHSQPSERNLELYLTALKKLSNFDQKLQHFILIAVNGIERCFSKKKLEATDCTDLIKQQNDKIEQLNTQIFELKNTVGQLSTEKHSLNKKQKDINSALTYMKKKGVPVEQYFQQFNQELKHKKSNAKDLDSSLTNLNLSHESKSKTHINKESETSLSNPSALLDTRPKNFSSKEPENGLVKVTSPHDIKSMSTNKDSPATASSLNPPQESRLKPLGIPRLTINPPSDVGFHQEFMARIDEFSDSWRELIKKEKISS